MGVMMAVNRQPAPTFDSSIRFCKLSAAVRHGKHKKRGEHNCLLATGGKDGAVLIKILSILFVKLILTNFKIAFTVESY